MNQILEKINNQYLFKGLVFCLAFILIYPKFPLLNIAGTYVAVRLEDILIALLIFVWTIVNLSNLLNFLKKSVTKTFILYWGIGLLSLLSAIFVTSTVVPHIGFLHWLRRIEMMMLFFVAATVIKDTRQVKYLLKVLILINIIIVLYGFGQIVFDLPVISTTNREFSKGLILNLTPGARVNSTFAGHYDLAVYLTIVIIFLGGFFFYHPAVKNLRLKALVMTSGLLSFILLGLTAARGSFVATFLALMATFWMSGKKLLIILLIVLGIGTVAIIPELRHRLVATITVNLIGGGGPKYQPPANHINLFTPDNQASFEAKRRVMEEATGASTLTDTPRVSTLSADIAAGEPTNTTELGVYRSFNIRTDVEWPRAIRGFLRNPLLGTGFSSLTIATDNDYLRSLGEVGILGTISLALILILLLGTFFKALRIVDIFEKIFLIATIASIFALLATALFIDVFEASKVASLFWVMCGVGWAIAKRYNYDN